MLILQLFGSPFRVEETPRFSEGPINNTSDKIHSFKQGCPYLLSVGGLAIVAPSDGKIVQSNPLSEKMPLYRVLSQIFWRLQRRKTLYIPTFAFYRSFKQFKAF